MKDQLYRKGLEAYKANDYNEAEKHLLEAVELGSIEAMHMLGTMHQWHWQENIDKEKAAMYYRKAIEQGGDIGSMMCMGMMCEQRPYNDYNAAIQWYEMAAGHGSGDAMCVLAWMYDRGYDIPQDYDKAIKWYHKAAEIGYSGGYHGLGTMYAEGQGVPKNDKKAFKLFLKSAEMGYELAFGSLARCYEYGIGVSADKIQAMKWYRLAADRKSVV